MKIIKENCDKKFVKELSNHPSPPTPSPSTPSPLAADIRVLARGFVRR